MFKEKKQEAISEIVGLGFGNKKTHGREMVGWGEAPPLSLNMYGWGS